MTTRLNADFNVAVIQRPEAAVWQPSPMPGVTRRMLDRIGDEVARATSVVRYAPQSQFSPHVHGGGEEILVLEGVFADEHGEYPAGTYLRNPRGTRHAPRTRPGSLLLVKLHQFAEDDDTSMCVAVDDGPWSAGDAPGIEVRQLHQHGRERVTVERWAAGTHCVRHAPAGGEELYVLSGALSDADQQYPAGTWLRLPPGKASPDHSSAGVRVYRKTGHLPL